MDKQAKPTRRRGAISDAADIEPDLTELTDLLNREKTGEWALPTGLFVPLVLLLLLSIDSVVVFLRYKNLGSFRFVCIYAVLLPAYAYGWWWLKNRVQAKVRAKDQAVKKIEAKILTPLEIVRLHKETRKKMFVAIGATIGAIVALGIIITLMGFVLRFGETWEEWAEKHGQAATIQAPPAPPPQRVNNLWKQPRRE